MRALVESCFSDANAFCAAPRLPEARVVASACASLFTFCRLCALAWELPCVAGMLCASCFSAANALCADERLLELRALARLLKSVLCCCSVLFLLSEEVPCAALLLKIPLIAMPKLRL